MAGGDEIAAEGFSFFLEITEFELFITHDAGIGSASRLVFAGEILDDRAFELVSLIHHVMGNAERMRDCSRVGHRLRTAAFVFRTGNAILRPHFHGYPHHVVASLAQKITGYAGIDSTAHTEKNALLFHRKDKDSFNRG